MSTRLRAPFPYFGGKAAIATQVWQWLGEVDTYVEPFFGSGAVLLQAPWPSTRLETVNDVDAMLANFWRALADDPEAVAHHADWPVNEVDQHARHAWLVGQKASLQAQLEGDPDWYDAKIAGWWGWGICGWIGSGWCSGQGPWHVVDGELQRTVSPMGNGIKRQRIHLGDGRGVQRQLVHLGGAGQGVQRKRVHLGNAGRGVQRKRVHVDGLMDWFRALADRLRRVRVCCGDWERVLGPSVTYKHGVAGVFLDPPYGAARERDIYAHDSLTVAQDVHAWCVANGSHPLLRIVLCGYGEEHDSLCTQGWRTWRWRAQGGMGNQGHGRGRAHAQLETCWLSPACQMPAQQELFPH